MYDELILPLSGRVDTDGCMCAPFYGVYLYMYKNTYLTIVPDVTNYMPSIFPAICWRKCRYLPNPFMVLIRLFLRKWFHLYS